MSHRQTPQETIAMTGFMASIVAYLAFALAEALRPGFVSRYFSIHLFLLATLAFGGWALAVTKRYGEWVVLQYAGAVLAGPALAMLVWQTGAGFGEFRLVAALFACLIPLAVLSLVRSSSSV